MRERIHLIGGGFEIHSNPGRGTRITGSELFLAKSDGTESRKLVSLTGRGFYPAWSPAGKKLRFTVASMTRPMRNSLWEVSAQGTNLHPLFPGWHNPPDECCGKWTADGKYFVFEVSGADLGTLRKGNLSSSIHGQAHPVDFQPARFVHPSSQQRWQETFRGRPDITAANWSAANLSPAGSRPFSRASLPKTLRFPKTASGWPTSPTPKASSGEASRMAARKIQLSSPPLLAALPRWSPDGKQIAFYDYSVGKPGKIYLVSADGGSPQQLLPEDPEPQQDPDWSPDGDKIIFGGVPG